MNERFWELVEQADEQGGDDPDIRDELFAKLIIQVCMEQVWHTREDSINGNVSEVIKNRIKQHFGVEQ